MVIQLKTGRVIIISLEQYLEMDDQDLDDLEGIPRIYTSESPLNPWAIPISRKENKEIDNDED